MMKRIDRKEIEQALRDLPAEASSAFALRVALRVLPLLVWTDSKHKAVFWFWKEEDRGRHLLAVLAACNVGLLGALDRGAVGKISEGVPAADASRSVADTATYAATAAATAAYAAATATTAYAAAYADATDAAAATDAAYSIFDISNDVMQDLILLKQTSEEIFLQQPLWSHSPPIAWQDLANTLKRTLSERGDGFEFWSDWLEARLTGEVIDTDLLIKSAHIPAAITAQGVAQVNAYLISLTNRTATAPLNRVRAIFIGEGAAGKTSLIHVLHQEAVASDEPMTPGIAIREWRVPDSEIFAHFWDFGGQVMVHATHQLFLRESCLYVLVLSARAEINATDQAEYWLEHVEAFGKSAPVMIVGNKLDQAAVQLDIRYLKSKYCNIVDFFPLSCSRATDTHRTHFATFSAEFARQLLLVGTHQMLFTAAQFKVLIGLRQRTPTAAFLTHDDFDELCAEAGVAADGVQNRRTLVEVLDKLGVIIHFPQLKFLDAYVLNPRWLTYGVYTLMYSQQPKLRSQDIVDLLSKEKVTDENGNVLTYPPGRCQFIRDAMQQFKLCYPLPNDPDTLIIPALLPAGVPAFAFDKTAALAFEFAFKGFLPRHVLPELIVNRHAEIQAHSAPSMLGEQIVWQHGVLLTHRETASQALAQVDTQALAQVDTQALVQVDTHLRSLSLWVAGPAARDYLAILRDGIKTILNRLTIECEELIVLPLAASICAHPNDRLVLKSGEKASLQQILAHERKGRKTFIAASGAEYDVGKIMQRFMPDATSTQITHIAQQTIHVDANDVGGNLVVGSTVRDSMN